MLTDTRCPPGLTRVCPSRMPEEIPGFPKKQMPAPQPLVSLLQLLHLYYNILSAETLYKFRIL